MGSVLGMLFIAATAAIGLFVGLRPTAIDGRQIAAELQKLVEGQGVTVECDREIWLGAGGARFACVVSRGGESERVEYTMTREGKYAPVGAAEAAKVEYADD